MLTRKLREHSGLRRSGSYSGSVPGLVMDSSLAQPRGKLRQSAGIVNLARVAVGNSLPSLGTTT